MTRKLVIWMLVAGCTLGTTLRMQRADAQTSTASGSGSSAMVGTVFIIRMTDTNMIRRSVISPNPISSYNWQVQDILNNYTLYSIEKAYPESRYRSLRSYYRIRANSLNLMHDLLAYSAGWFPTGFKESRPVPAYQPSEFFNGSGCDTFLRYIKADGAWNYTKGDPAVVIGISDTYFDQSNPDLSGRIANVRHSAALSNLPPSQISHGTQTAGFAVGNMDNGGLVGVGGFCKLDIDSYYGDRASLALSKGDALGGSRKIVNASWTNPNYSCTDDPAGANSSEVMAGVGIYNEVYENGAVAVCAAGNSGGTSPACGSMSGTNPYTFEEADVRAFMYPASYDHALSVSGVGFGPHRVTPTGSNGAAQRLNWSDMHCLDAQDPSTAMHHNSRVDLLAPSYFMPSLDYDPNDPNVHTRASVAGTSYSAPMVSGAIGLMQSVAGQCLSPYQVEYLLKTNADTAVFGEPENAAYAGMLGAGVLDAEAAVRKSRYITGLQDPCNDPATQTFIIKSVEINTICAPGLSDNGVEPKLKLVLENGTPPYTYKWTRQYPNAGDLDNDTIAEPTITYAPFDPSAMKPRFVYWVSVTDHSPVPKVASREVIIYFKTSGYDIAMRDGSVDFFREPYDAGLLDPRERIWWAGPDVWNRRTPDGGLAHQDPEYYATDSNHLYTRIRNVGCAASPSTAKLRLYWTLQSTGEDWDRDWTTADFPGNPNLPAGREITQVPMSIPAMQPGEQVILHHGWRSQNPSDYGSNLTELNACVLARVEESPAYPHGMTFAEARGPVGKNVTNNNNIVTRNLTFVDLAPGDLVPEFLLIFGNPHDAANTFMLRLIPERTLRPEMSGNFSAIAFVRIRLGQKLFERWMGSGGKGNYAATDSRNYTVDFDGSGTMSLEGIVLDAGERIPVFLQFIQREWAVTTGMDYTLHLVQSLMEPDPENPDADPVTGGVDFVVHTKKAQETNMKKTLLPGGLQQQYCKVYPNPVSDRLHLESAAAIKSVTLCDMAGRLLIRDHSGSSELNLQPLKAGIYILGVTDVDGHTQRFKIVKQ